MVVYILIFSFLLPNYPQSGEMTVRDYDMCVGAAEWLTNAIGPMNWACVPREVE